MFFFDGIIVKGGSQPIFWNLALDKTPNWKVIKKPKTKLYKKVPYISYQYDYN